MQTQTTNPAEIRAQIDVFKQRKVSLEKKLAGLTNDAALALVRGQDTGAIDTIRHQTAEDAARLAQLIDTMQLGLELAEVETAKLGDTLIFEKSLAKLAEIKPRAYAVKQRITELSRELSALKKEYTPLDHAVMGNIQLSAAMRDKLKKKHGMTDGEIAQIEAKYRP